jgi:hypothetical protein
MARGAAVTLPPDGVDPRVSVTARLAGFGLIGAVGTLITAICWTAHPLCAVPPALATLYALWALVRLA